MGKSKVSPEEHESRLAKMLGEGNGRTLVLDSRLDSPRSKKVMAINYARRQGLMNGPSFKKPHGAAYSMHFYRLTDKGRKKFPMLRR